MMKALVVDDSRAVRMIVSRILKELGFEVREAGNGKEALEQMNQSGSPFELVLADWNMPEVNGLELLQSIRRESRYSQVKVVMVTTETELDQMAIALASGANEYVMKPFTKEILVEKLELAGILEERVPQQ